MTKTYYKQFGSIYSVKKEIFLDCLKIQSLKRKTKKKNLLTTIPIIKAYTRWTKILPIMAQLRIYIVNGRKKDSFFLPIQDKHITFRLGEFLFTRKLHVKHKGKKTKIKINPKEIMRRRKMSELAGNYHKKMKKKH